MILCQHTNKDEEEGKISKPGIYTLDGKRDLKISCLACIITPKKG